MHALTMSIRSRLETEVAYALNALQILSAGTGAPSNFQFLLAPCEDLLDELLELLEECAYGHLDEEEEMRVGGATAARRRDKRKRTNGVALLNGHACGEKEETDLEAEIQRSTYRDWVQAATEEAEEMRLWRRRKLPRSQSAAGDGAEEGQGSAVMANGTPSTPMVVDGASDGVQVNGRTRTSDALRAEQAQLDDKEWQIAEEERRLERAAGISLCVINILRNFSMMPDNVDYMTGQQRLLDLLAKLCRSDDEIESYPAFDEESEDGIGLDEEGPQGQGVVSSRKAKKARRSTIFTRAEILRVRKDVLVTVANLSGERLQLQGRSDETVVSLFDLLSSFIYDAGALEESECTPEQSHPFQAMQQAHLGSLSRGVRRIPHYADVALDAFSRLALPDSNREIIAHAVNLGKLAQLGTELVRLLPVTEADFQLLKTEPRLAYVERIAMGLYNLAFLAPPRVKARLRAAPGFAGIVFRIVKRLMRAVPDFNRNPFGVLCRRLIEALRLISDGADLFGAPALLGFGFDSAPAIPNDPGSGGGGGVGIANGFARAGRQAGLLLDEEQAVVEAMGTPSLDETVVAELNALLAFG